MQFLSLTNIMKVVKKKEEIEETRNNFEEYKLCSIM